ncbi:MAG: MFS transporter [Dermatophilaceae bacterium]
MTPSASAAWTGAKLKAFYFLFYGSVGIYVMFFAPYLRGLGFSGAEIGFVTVLGPFVGIVGALCWAVVADRWGATTRTLRWCTMAALAPLVFVPFARTPQEFAAIIVLHNAFAPACVPLIDSLTFEWLRTEQRGNYTRVRLYGALGGLATVQGVGLLLTLRGERTADIVFPVAWLSIVAAIAALAQTLPEAPPRDRPPKVRDLVRLSRSPSLRLFLFICLLHWICLAPYDLLFGVFLRDRGLPSSFAATVLVGGSLAEAAMMFAFTALHKRIGIRSLFGAAFVVMGVRWWLLSESYGPIAIATVQVLHGAAVGLFWGTMVQAVGHIVPARLRVTGHALFAAVVVGGGNTVGYYLAGIGYDQFGGVDQLFRLAAVFEVAPLALLLLVGRRFDAHDGSLTTNERMLR